LHTEIGALQHKGEEASSSIECHEHYITISKYVLELQCLKVFKLTHDANDEPPVKRLNCNTEQEEADGDLGEADGPKIHWLSDEIEFERRFEMFDLNVLDMPSSSIVDLWYDEALSSNALFHCQCWVKIRKCEYPLSTSRIS
jgi:hypothetical protein